VRSARVETAELVGIVRGQGPPELHRPGAALLERSVVEKCVGVRVHHVHREFRPWVGPAGLLPHPEPRRTAGLRRKAPPTPRARWA
jgi:hypothetical protein